MPTGAEYLAKQRVELERVRDKAKRMRMTIRDQQRSLEKYRKALDLALTGLEADEPNLENVRLVLRQARAERRS